MTDRTSRNGSAMSAYSSASIRLDPNAMINHSELLQNYISSKSIYQLQEKSDVEVQLAKSKVDQILDREKTVIKESIDPLLIGHFISEQRRKEVLNKRWNRAVFEPICRRIESIVDSGKIDDLCIRKRQMHQNYLDYINRKGFASLTEICPDEYYPYVDLRRDRGETTLQSIYPASRPRVPPSGRTPSANPTALDQLSRLDEQNFQIRCVTGHQMDPQSLLQLDVQPAGKSLNREHTAGRQGCDCISWAYMPYGQINSEVRHKCRKKMLGNYNNSSAHLCLMNSRAAKSLEDNYKRISI